MSFSEIPGKVIERAESLTETKLQVAASLTNLIYSENKKNLTEEQILKTYFNFYDGIKLLAHPPMEKSTHKKLKAFFIIGGIIVLILFLASLLRAIK